MGVLVVCVGRGWGEGVEGCSPVWEPGGARAACLRQAEIKPQFCFVLFYFCITQRRVWPEVSAMARDLRSPRGATARAMFAHTGAAEVNKRKGSAGARTGGIAANIPR